MNNTFAVRPFLGAVVRVTAAISLLIGLVAVAPALIPAQAHAAETPAPMTHTIDYILLSTSPNADFLSTADLQARTDRVSRAWNRMSRGVVSEVRMGSVYTLPNFSSGPDFCNLTKKDTTGVLQATVGHSLDVYKDPASGHHLAVIARRPDTLSCWFGGLALTVGSSTSAGGILLLASSGHDPYSDANIIAHEIGHNMGLMHAAVSPNSCAQNFPDGPFQANAGMSADGCPLNSTASEYGDGVNVMGGESSAETMDRITLNGAQMYQLGLIQPGAGVKEVTAGADEQLITIQNRRTTNPDLPQTVRMTADDPDGSGPCRPAIYHIDYDPVLGGVQVVRVPRTADCGSRDPYGIGSIAWTMPKSFEYLRTFFLPGESRLTENGKVQVRVVSVDEAAQTATIGVRRTDVAGFETLQLTSRLLEPGNIAHVPADGGQLTANVTTNQTAWSADANQPWAKVTGSGTSGQEIAVAMGANPGAEERTVVVTVRAGTAVSTISVVQQPGPSQDDCAATRAWSCGWQDPGSPVRGTIETPDDTDWFLIAPQTTGTWSFTVSGLTDPVVTPFYPAGWDMPSTTEVLGDNQVRMSVDLRAGMPCYLTITGNGVSTGGYTITAAPAAPIVTVSGDAVDVPGGGGATLFKVTSNTLWRMSPLPEWLTASRNTGLGSQIVMVYATPNTTGVARTWSVELAGQGQTASVAVSQAPGSVPPTECGVTPATACTQADMSSPRHTIIDYAGDKDWFTLTPDVSGTWSISGTNPAATGILFAGDATTEVAWDRGSAVGVNFFHITTMLVANQTYYLEVSANSSGTGPYTLVVTPPADAVVTPVTPTISVSPDTWNVTDSGGTREVQVSSNGAWEVKVPDWITASPDSGTGDASVTLTAKPNTGGQERNDTVQFTTTGAQATVLVRQTAQQGDGTIWVSSASWHTTAFGGVNVIQVKSNTNWQVSVPEWVTASPASGSGDATVTLTVKPNTTGELRNSAAVFSVSGKQVSIPIVQPSFWK